MKNETEVVFFDLFYTLVTPKYSGKKNEYDVLGLCREKWEKYSEDETLYINRATGKIKNPRTIIQKIVEKIKTESSENEIDEILRLRVERFKEALLNIDPAVLSTLAEIKNSGKRLCLISNADTIDVMYWDESSLSKLFDERIFSFEAGCLKPDSKIYKFALEKMKCTPSKAFFVGDGGSDELKGAKKAGISTIRTSFLLEKEEQEYGRKMPFADYYVDDFKDILKILDGKC